MSRRNIIDIDDTPKSERDRSKPRDVITITVDDDEEDEEEKAPRRRESFLEKMIRKIKRRRE